MEQDIEIVKNGEYNNINLKPNFKKGVKGLAIDNHIIVEKTKYAEGREIKTKFGSMYSCLVRYKDTDVSFICSDKEHASYVKAGGVGDKIKILMTKFTWTNRQTGMESSVPRLSFEVVN
jgi:K+-transporting ATPase A subunit